MPYRILVVDDEKGIAETLITILRIHGYQAEAASDGAEGYEIACRFKPDLIISDIAMPKCNGIEMAIRIVAKIPKVKILLISGQAVTVESLQQARARGYFFECLAKPIHPTDLLHKIEAILASVEAADLAVG